MPQEQSVNEAELKYVEHQLKLLTNYKESLDLETKHVPAYSWVANKVLAFDLETTSRNPNTARIVTASIVESWGIPATPDNSVLYEWLLRPSEPISDEAYSVHGVSNSEANKNGLNAKYAVKQIVGHLQTEINKGTPIVGYNSSYDLTILNRECLRLGIAPLDETDAIIIDPLIIDLFFDPKKR